MYVRRKPNRSGSTSVVVIKKNKGKDCYLKTIGVSSDGGNCLEFEKANGNIERKYFAVYFSTGFSEKFLSTRCLMDVF